MICWVINHCLEVSCKVDQITSAEREWFICLQLADKLWFITQQIMHKFITQQIMHKSWSISFLTHRKRRKSKCILQILPTFRHRIKKSRQQFWLTLMLTCISYVADSRKTALDSLTSWPRRLTFSNVSKWRRNGARSRRALPPGDLLPV